MRIALNYAALNEIGVQVANIRNAYLQAPVSEKHYIICGHEFVIENIGRVGLLYDKLCTEKRLQDMTSENISGDA